MSTLKRPIQPFIIAVGQDIANLNAFYIRIDSVTYQLPSLLKAFDVLFKIYIIYKICYPIESETFGYFIQWGIYNIHTKEDVQMPFIYNTLNKLRLQKK